MPSSFRKSSKADAEPVENGGNAAVRQRASQFTDQLHGLHVGLPAVLASTVLHHFKPRVIPALPMQHEAQPIGLDRDDDLPEDSPQNPLAGFVGRSGMVP